MNCDPAVMEFLSGVGTPRAKIAAFLQKQQIHVDRYGWGWMVIETQQEKIGFVFLQHCSRLAEIELGYRIRQDYWRQGYATESAELLLHHALNQLDMERVVAAVDPLNIASERVLQRIGMRYWKDVAWETTPSGFARCYRAP
jgi:ribosomal-protein-alanine N-acetyltransferase